MYFSFFLYLCAAVYGVIKNNNNNNSRQTDVTASDAARHSVGATPLSHLVVIYLFIYLFVYLFQVAIPYSKT